MSQVAAKVIRDAYICHLPDATGLSCSLSSPPHPTPPSPQPHCIGTLPKARRLGADKQPMDNPDTCQLHMSLNLCLLLGHVGANLCR